MRNLPRLSLLALLTIYIVWGSTYLAIRIALDSFPPFILMASRFLVAGALLYVWQRLRGAPNPNAREWRDAFIIGALLLGGGMGLTAIAELTVSSGITAVFVASAPMMVALFSGLYGDWPSKGEWLGIVIGFLGVALLAAGDDFSAHAGGVLAILGGVASWTFGSVVSQRSLKLAPGPMGFASEMLAGGAVLTMMVLVKGESMPVHWAWPAVGAWAYLVVVGSLIGFSAYMYLLANVSNTLASSYAYVNPVIAVLLGAALAHENVALREVLAMVVILASVLLLTTARKRRDLGDETKLDKEAHETCAGHSESTA